MARIECFTSATYSYLDRVRVLGKTLRRFHPDWKFSLCLSDRKPPGYQFDPQREPIDDLVRIEDLGIPNLEQWIFKHDIIELCTAVKGAMLCRLLDSGAEKVVYLDPDIALFSNLNEIDELLERFEIILTPHQISPDDKKQAIIDNEIGSMKYGIFNLGFLAVAGRSEGYRFAEWWRSRLMEFCFAEPSNGLFTDQKWCDHVPAMFSNVHVLRDPGYNVASWNLSCRPITIEPDGSIRAGGKMLRFFHFTKINNEGAVMLERYGSAHPEVFELSKWYGDLLAENREPNIPEGWWAFKRYSDGTPIQKKERVAYRESADLCAAYPNPFDSGPRSLAAHLKQQSGVCEI